MKDIIIKGYGRMTYEQAQAKLRQYSLKVLENPNNFSAWSLGSTFAQSIKEFNEKLER